MTTLIGAKRTLELEDLPPLEEANTAEALGNSLQHWWNLEMQKPKPSLLYALHRCFGRTMYLAGIYRFVSDTCAVSSPVVMMQIVIYLQEVLVSDNGWTGYMLAVLIFILQFLQTTCMTQSSNMVVRAGYRLRGAMIAILYSKSLKLSPIARQDFTSGESGCLLRLQPVNCQL